MNKYYIIKLTRVTKLCLTLLQCFDIDYVCKRKKFNTDYTVYLMFNIHTLSILHHNTITDDSYTIIEV
jgi:hypothetical protein